MKKRTIFQIKWLFLILLLISCQYIQADQDEEATTSATMLVSTDVTPTSILSYATSEMSNSRIVFVSYRDDNAEIYVMNADGSGQTRLTNNESDDTAPSWSPDGEQIIFVSERDGISDLYIMNADGSHQRRLIDTPDYKNWPRWSPDGEQIVFNNLMQNGLQAVSVFDLDTGEVKQVTGSDYNAARPSWYSDGQSILFTSGKDHTNIYLNEIYFVSLTDSSVRLLSNLEEENTYVEPILSPNDQRIIFSASRDPIIGMIDIVSLEITWMVDHISDEQLRAELLNSGQLNPNWSPDGQQIIFASGEIWTNIYVLDLQSGNLKQLTDSAANDLAPDWWAP